MPLEILFLTSVQQGDPKSSCCRGLSPRAPSVLWPEATGESAEATGAMCRVWNTPASVGRVPARLLTSLKDCEVIRKEGRGEKQGECIAKSQ